MLTASAGEALRTYEVDSEGGKLQPTGPPGFQTLPITVPPVLKRQVCAFGSVIYPHFERIHLPVDFGGFYFNSTFNPLRSTNLASINHSMTAKNIERDDFPIYHSVLG